jgi:hypothetical protein
LGKKAEIAKLETHWKTRSHEAEIYRSCFRGRYVGRAVELLVRGRGYAGRQAAIIDTEL